MGVRLLSLHELTELSTELVSFSPVKFRIGDALLLLCIILGGVLQDIVGVGVNNCWLKDVTEGIDVGGREPWCSSGWGGNKREAANAGCRPVVGIPETPSGEQCRSTGEPSSPVKNPGNDTGDECSDRDECKLIGISWLMLDDSELARLVGGQAPIPLPSLSRTIRGSLLRARPEPR